MTRKGYSLILMLAATVLLLAACSGAGPSSPTTPTGTLFPPTPTAAVVPAEATATPSPTPTIPAQGAPAATPEPPESPCAGLSGQIEVHVLVGPADAVGLEPVAVGLVPLAVVADEEPFLIQGAGDISYADILVAEWGTYEVTLDMNTTVGGECVATADSAMLELVVTMKGQQMVKVESEHFQGEYPWSGDVPLDVTFPLVEGATAQGEGWLLVLHLNSQ